MVREEDLVAVEIVLDLSHIAVVIDVDAGGLPDDKRCILSEVFRVDYEVNRVILQVLGRAHIQSSRILERDNVPVSQMHLIVSQASGLHLHLTVSKDSDAVLSRCENIAPNTLGEVVSVALCCPVLVLRGFDRELERRAKHDVLGRVCTEGSLVVGELKEDGLVEGAHSRFVHTQLEQLSVVVSEKTILLEDGSSHNLSVAHPVEGVVNESEWLLRLPLAVPVIAGEWLEHANLMPPCAQLGSRVRSSEAAYVTSNIGNAEHVHHHGPGD